MRRLTPDEVLALFGAFVLGVSGLVLILGAAPVDVQDAGDWLCVFAGLALAAAIAWIVARHHRHPADKARPAGASRSGIELSTRKSHRAAIATTTLPASATESAHTPRPVAAPITGVTAPSPN